MKFTINKEVLKKNRLWIVSCAIMLLVLITASIVFASFMVGFRDKVEEESADHLIEINKQVQLYVEQTINTDWRVLYSLITTFTTFSSGDQISKELLMHEISVWGLSDIYLYTENGACVNPNGDSKQTDKSSMMVYYARRNGRYLSILQNTLIFTLPINTNLSINGSKLVAVSAVHNLSSFMDHMDFESFDNSAFMYLAQENGAVVSQMTHHSATYVYNIVTLLGEEKLHCIDESVQHTNVSLLADTVPRVHILDYSQQKYYLVTTPIDMTELNLRLIYMAPVSNVNKVTNSFADNVVILAIILLVFTTVVFAGIFIVFTRARGKEYNSELSSREHMFDLLTQNTENAYSLLSTKQSAPLFCSSNAQKITGFSTLRIEKDEGTGVIRLTSSEETIQDALNAFNNKLKGWNKQSEIISDAMKNDASSAEEAFGELRLYPVTDNPDEFICLWQDVTLSRTREKQLSFALDMANSANEAKTRFLANMSHDIRTPMNAIINMTDFALNSKDDPEKQTEYLSTIRESAAHLLQLINDVLDMSRIESGQSIVASIEFSPTDCITEVAEIVRPLATAKEQTFNVSDSIAKSSVLGDKLKLSQILVNILNNAVKFTPIGGSIDFSAEEIPSLRKEYAVLRFTVTDNGIGISPEDITQIFNPFTRADDNRVTKTEGTGLGLSICNSYVKAMGGTIRCESPQKKGSTFIVEIPFRICTESTPATERSAVSNDTTDLKGKRVLLCEDNQINQVIAKKLLEQIGFKVETASDGDESTFKFLSSLSGYYSVIYMDIQMPFMNGYDATTIIRSSAHPQAKTIPIIAMTANVFADDVEKSRRVGMNGHIGKPIEADVLLAETERVLSMGEQV